MNLYLFQRNEKVCGIDLRNGKYVVHTVFNRSLLPVALKSSNRNTDKLDKFDEWMKARSIPDDREGLLWVKEQFGTDCIDSYKAKCTLTDQYWIGDGTTTWEEENFFTNFYTSTVGDMFFRPHFVQEKDLCDLKTPDLTTGGSRFKRWIQDEDKISFLQYGVLRKPQIREENEISDNSTILGEILTKFISKVLDLTPPLDYHFFIATGRIGYSVRNICSENTEFVPMNDIANLCQENLDDYGKIVNGVKYINYQGDIESYLKKIIIHDSILGITNRSLYDFGFLHNIDTDEWKVSPLIRVGNSFNCLIQGKGRRAERGRFTTQEKLLKDEIQSRKKEFFIPMELVKTEGWVDFIDSFPSVGNEVKGTYKAKFNSFISSNSAAKEEPEIGSSRE